MARGPINVPDAEDLQAGDPPPDPEEQARRNKGFEELQGQGENQEEQDARRRWLAVPRETRVALRRLHTMTGHSSKGAMLRMLRGACARRDVIEGWQHFQCTHCSMLQQPRRESLHLHTSSITRSL